MLPKSYLQSQHDFLILVLVMEMSGVQSDRSVIIRVINKIRFVNQVYDYRQNWTTQSLITNKS